MKKPLIRAGIPLLALLAVFAAIYADHAKTSRTSPVLRATGILDGIEVNLSPKVAGKISWTCCKEGDKVKEGQVAVTLESADLKASEEQAAAGVERAKADITTAEASSASARANMLVADADMKSAAADMTRARTQMEESQREAGRAKELFEKGFISRESRDQLVAAYDSNAAAYDSFKEKLNSARSKKDAAISQLNSAVSQLNSAKAALKETLAALSFSRSKLADTVIKTPVTGVVIFKAMETGETVSPGVTIMTVVDLDSLYARVDVDETRIGGVVLNGSATVTVDGLPGKKFQGLISEIGRYAEFATQRDVIRGREDIKTFRVKVRVDDSKGLLKPGMTVEVEIPKRG